MRSTMTRLTQPNQIVQPMRIRPAPPGKMMHRPHRRHPAILTHPVAALPHLLPTLRVHRVPLPPAGTHRISFRKASSNVLRSTFEKYSASRCDTGIPPALSNLSSEGRMSSFTFTIGCRPHTRQRHVSRQGARSNLVSRSSTGICASHQLHTESCATLSGSSSGEVGFGLVGCEE